MNGPTPTRAPAVVSITYPVPTADVAPSSLSFPTTAQGVASAQKELTVTNNGSAPLIVSGVLLGGSNRGDYLINDGCQEPVAAASSCHVGVRFDPQVQGPAQPR